MFTLQINNMSSKVKEIKSFTWDGFSLGQPNGLQGGSYFSKASIGYNPILLQLPACVSKQGLVNTEKKRYCDLMYTSDDEEVIAWFEKLEEIVKEQIFEKRALWFDNELDKDDIESAFISPLRSYKSGSKWLIRSNILRTKSTQGLCYSEAGEVMALEEFNKENCRFIPLIEVIGVKFTSKNFQIEISLRQCMILDEVELAECLIVKNSGSGQSDGLRQSDSLRQSDGLRQTHSLGQSDSLRQTDEEENSTLGIVEAETEVNEEVSTAEPEVREKTESNDAEPSIKLELEPEPGLEPEHEPELKLEPELEISNAETNALENKEEEEPAQPPEQAENTEEQLKTEEQEPDAESDNESETLSVLTEVDITPDETDEHEELILKKPSEVYYNLWKETKNRAKLLRKEAIQAFLEAKEIKASYLNNIDFADMANEQEDSSDNEEEFAIMQ